MSLPTAAAIRSGTFARSWRSTASFYLSQRFAIDWEQIDDEGRLLRGDPKDTRSYHIFGDPVLAVADAIVVASRNDLPEQVPGKLPDGLPIDEADGNFVIMDIGGGAYALYAHMQPGSVRVRPEIGFGAAIRSATSATPATARHRIFISR